MSVTLDPILQAAQDGRVHDPTARILSNQASDAIPFQGNLFDHVSTYTLRPGLIHLSDNRLAATFMDDNVLRYQYTDADKTEWTVVTPSMSYGTGYVPQGACPVELPDGTVGLLIRAYKSGTGYALMWAEITSAGAVVTAPTLIESYAEWISEAHVIRLENGTFAAVYSERWDNAGTDNYRVRVRTATTWGSFSAESTLSLSDLTAEYVIDNPAIMQDDAGHVWLVLEHQTAVSGSNAIINLFCFVSTDNMATWNAPSQRTTWEDFGYSSHHPIMAKKSDGTIWLIYYNRQNVQTLDKNADGMNYDDEAGNEYYAFLHFDSVNNKLIGVWVTYLYSWTKHIGAVVVIDVDNWSIDKTFYSGSTPALNAYFLNHGVNVQPIAHEITAYGNFIAIADEGTDASAGHTDKFCIALINTVTNEIRYYVGAPYGDTSGYYSSYGLPANVPYTGTPYFTNLKGIHLDSLNRLWLLFGSTHYTVNEQYWGYIDITESPDEEGNYTLHFTSPNGVAGFVPNNYHDYTSMTLSHIAELDYLMVNGKQTYNDDEGVLWLYDREMAAEVTRWRRTSHANFPLHGLDRAWYSKGHIYGSFTYCSYSEEMNKRGLCDIDMAADTVTFYRPTYATKDQYTFYDMVVDNDGNLIFAVSEGLAKFNVTDKSWLLLSEDNVPGLQLGYSGTPLIQVEYDPATGRIFTCNLYEQYTPPAGYLAMLDEDGPLEMLQYQTYDPTEEEWSEGADLAVPTEETEPVAVIDENDVLWVFWGRFNYDTGTYYLAWDRDQGQITLTDDLDDLTITWDMGQATKAVFVLGRGHLYDPHNSRSTLNGAVAKGRKVEISLGEIVSGISYLQEQCTVIVEEAALSHGRGDYPDIRVTCKDRLSMLSQMQQVTSNLYSNEDPDTICRDICSDAGLAYDECSFTTLVNTHKINTQFVDMTPLEQLEMILDHFFYVPATDAAGVIIAKQINLGRAVDHVYTDTKDIETFMPDDTFSSYTNQIRVIGESDDWTNVTYDEECVGTLAGTIGWWEKKLTHKVWFSEDHKKACINPRLHVIQSIELQGLLMEQLATGSGGESITEVDPDGHYCIVTIEVEDLTAALVAVVASILALGVIALCIDVLSAVVAGILIFILTIQISLLVAILAAVANYQYEIWASPRGQVRQTVQAVADDLVFQRQLGFVVTEGIEDSLCYSVGECQRVANGTLDLVIAERNRAKVSKPTHLQDEIMDLIRFPHLYSGEDIDLFIVKLERHYKRGAPMTDQLDGWRIRG